jgi:hypothetical protein
MCANPEIETDEITGQEVADLKASASTCNGFAFNYLEEHESAVVKDALIRGGDIAHCYVYDRDRDITIDATLGQFNGKPAFGAWDGDEHPYRVEHEEVREWESREAFEDYYADRTGADFIV